MSYHLGERVSVSGALCRSRFLRFVLAAFGPTTSFAILARRGALPLARHRSETSGADHLNFVDRALHGNNNNLTVGLLQEETSSLLYHLRAISPERARRCCAAAPLRVEGVQLRPERHRHPQTRRNARQRPAARRAGSLRSTLARRPSGAVASLPAARARSLGSS